MARFNPSKIVALRLRAGMTREQFATAIDRSYQTVAFYERGAQKPPTEILERMADLFGVSVGEFFDSPLEAVGA